MKLAERDHMALIEHGDGYVLVKDGALMSYVNPDDPTDFSDLFPYMAEIARHIDALPKGPLRVVHIGGGAMTLPRYISHTRPQSSSVVVEPDMTLLDMVRDNLPWPSGEIFTVNVRGESYLQKTIDTNEDLVIMDAFVGYRTPEELTTVECFENVRRILKPGGVMIANIIEDRDMYLLNLMEVFNHSDIETFDVPTEGTVGNLIVVAR